MSFVAPRTCTEVTTDARERFSSKPFTSFRDRPAFVMLGDPGSGKTTAFEEEAKELGDDCMFLSARKLITFSPANRLEWRNKTLFVDGLDEVRAGQSDARTPFDAIRARLDELGRPRFRLSCRSADWFGAADRKKLDEVSPDSSVAVLVLDPLSDDDIVSILSEHPDIDHPRAFIAGATSRGLGGMLANPQTLELLVESVAVDGQWPSSRKETFEIATASMTAEHNSEHTSVGNPFDVDQIKDAAGRLCLVQLVAGCEGYASRQRHPDQEFIDPRRCGIGDLALLRHSLSTKLFSVDETGGSRPIHRHIAEYLGSVHLARLIADGLPAGRVIALMSGEDGFVVSELRGLSAWLATNSCTARPLLIQLDPIGVGHYGDISDFSLDDKLALLKSLARETSAPGYMFAAQAFSDLAIPELVSVFLEAFTCVDRETEHQSFVAFLLLTLIDSHPMPTLSNALYDIVFDESWWPGVRHSALKVFAKYCEAGFAATCGLKPILTALHDGSLGDRDNELLGTLLASSYPSHLPASEVLDYLHEGGDPGTIGSYLMFWKRKLIDASSDDDIAVLLDRMAGSFDDFQPAIERHMLDDLPLELLERGLNAHGDGMEAARLYDWLSMGSNSNRRRRGDGVRAEIRTWLEKRPGTLKSVLADGLIRPVEPENFRFHAYSVERCLFGAELPPDFGLWCLRQAVMFAYANPPAAEHFLERAVSAHRSRSGNEGLSIDLLRDLTAEHNGLSDKLDRLLATDESSSDHRHDDRMEEMLRESRRREGEWLDYVQSQIGALTENRAPHQLLYRLANSYFGGLDRISEVPGVRGVEDSLKNQPDLVSASLEGIKSAIYRSDIPDIDEVLKLRSRSRKHLVTFAVLAGMAEIERVSPEKLIELTDEQIRKALTCHYSWHQGQFEPTWYRTMLQHRPDIVAEVQTRFAVADFKTKGGYIHGLWHLSHDEEHAEVARLVSIPLLQTFPARASLKHSEALENLLLAAIKLADRKSLEGLIDKKLQLKSMDVAQRARWLAAGLSVSPDKFLAATEEFLRDSERRVRHLTSLFHKDVSDPVDARVARLLIHVAGRSYAPDEFDADGWVTPEMQGSQLVRNLIQGLAGTTDREAMDALDALAHDPDLLSWREVISRSRENQRVLRRDATYRHPTVEQVANTLNRSAPANSADLAALIVDRFEVLERRIRTGSTDDWRQYWNEDRYGRPVAPKHEDHCRDALLSDLRLFIPEGVEAHREGQYANDRRSDIRVTAPSSCNVPVEIKKNSHRDLWTSIDDQLINRYTTDPETRGYGIYLVFWFGRERTQISPEGSRPKNPTELREALWSRLPDEHKRKISVCVIDVDSNR